MSDILLRPIIAMQVAVHQLREREDGQTTTEYAILLGFLAIAIIIALFFLRNVLRSLFSTAASSVSRAPRLELVDRYDHERPAQAGRSSFAGPALRSRSASANPPFGRLPRAFAHTEPEGARRSDGQPVTRRGRAPLRPEEEPPHVRHPVATDHRDAGRGASAAGARGWPDDDRVRNSARLPRNRHHRRTVLPEERAAQPLLERGQLRFAGTRLTQPERIRGRHAATSASVRRPGYPLDRVGAYVFLMKFRTTLSESGNRGHNERRRQASNCRPGEGDRDSWIDPTVPIGTLEAS